MSPTAECPFCKRIEAGEYESFTDETNFPSVVWFEPLSPVTPGHMLFVPVRHLEDALADPYTTANTMEYAARWWRSAWAGLGDSPDCNLITSAGANATQTVKHLHIHLVPRREGDGLHLPWTGQQERERDIARYAGVLHSEHHPGTFVPTLDDCPEHDRADYEARVREMNARSRA